MAMINDLEEQARIEALLERIAKVFLLNQLHEAYLNCPGTLYNIKIGDEMIKLRNELWP